MSIIETNEDVPGKAKRTRTSALDRILQVLDFLQNNDAPATAYEIARAVGAPLSTIYTLVEDLVEKEMIDRREDGRLWFGHRLYHYGLTYARHVDLLSAANHEMSDLALASGETVQICGRDGDHMVVLGMVDGPDHFQVASQVGSRTPLNWSASGRLLIGHLPEAERREIFTRATRPSPTGRAETDIDVLVSSSRQAFESGLSIQAGESAYAIACIAAPIVDPAGHCRATISIVVPDNKVAQTEPDLPQLVRASAARIARRLGW
ncbi:IclR family transcriptional regulator [Pelagibacterium limicola]|uniref:IclR family transcriptional regulator n=1 Tax=Pelagibacterium limicola TaxID=2791022 RepID=UPI0018AFF74E|nr:IclR family transcriptional regulator [Pelagibacterium limicola]